VALYDTIGVGYARNRRPDPRWSAIIHHAIGNARRVLNVGAGAGSYEPEDRSVIALEPSRRMMAQRNAHAAPVVQGVADAMPFPDQSFDVALAVLTAHHWPDATAGLAEMRRVAARQVVVTWEPAEFADRFWLVRDYLSVEDPDDLVAGRRIASQLRNVRTVLLPVPHDCTDGVFGAYWRRPEAYLDASVRASISGLALADPDLVREAMLRLEADLGSGAWERRHGELRALDELDLGYCVLAAEG
jgi:SAM-dependent methyltransferase